EDDREIASLARLAAREGMSVRAVEEQVRRRRDPKAEREEPEEPAGSAHVRHLESELQRALGTAVKIRNGRGDTGRVEIPFYSADDFERITELLLGGAD